MRAGRHVSKHAGRQAGKQADKTGSLTRLPAAWTDVRELMEAMLMRELDLDIAGEDRPEWPGLGEIDGRFPASRENGRDAHADFIHAPVSPLPCTLLHYLARNF